MCSRLCVYHLSAHVHVRQSLLCYTTCGFRFTASIFGTFSKLRVDDGLTAARRRDARLDQLLSCFKLSPASRRRASLAPQRSAPRSRRLHGNGPWGMWGAGALRRSSWSWAFPEHVHLVADAEEALAATLTRLFHNGLDGWGQQNPIFVRLRALLQRQGLGRKRKGQGTFLRLNLGPRTSERPPFQREKPQRCLERLG